MKEALEEVMIKDGADSTRSISVSPVIMLFPWRDVTSMERELGSKET